MVNNNQQVRVQGFLLTPGHLKGLLFLAWAIGVLPLLTWWALIQFLPVAYLQVFLPYMLLYGLAITEEIVRGFVTKGQ